MKLGLKYQITPKIALFANWQYGSGLPYILIKTDSPFAPLSNNLAAGQVERIGEIIGHLLPAIRECPAAVQVVRAYSEGKAVSTVAWPARPCPSAQCGRPACHL